MSAVGANAGDREAVRRAQRAHEASMEEILASIRTIIAEERAPAKSGEAKEPARAAAATPSAPQIVYSKPDPSAAHRDVGPSPPAPPRPEPQAESAPKVVWRQPEPADAPPPPTDDGTPPAEADAPLLSADTDRAVGSAFDALSASLAARSAERADDLARELLRPMLKAWLDENLPAMVERLVKSEIERVVRRHD